MATSLKSIAVAAALLLSAPTPALAETTYMSCKSGWNNPTLWGHAFLELIKSDSVTSLKFSFDSNDRLFRHGPGDSEYTLSKDGFAAGFRFRQVALTDLGDTYSWRRDDSIVGKTGNKVSSGVIVGGVIAMKESDEIARISDYENITIDRTNLSMRYEMLDARMEALHGSARVSTFQCATLTQEAFVAAQHERLTKAWKKGIAPLIKQMNAKNVDQKDLKI